MEEVLTDDEDFLQLINLIEYNVPRRRLFRPRINHFQRWSENEFFDRFRVSKITARHILERINIGRNTKRNQALSREDMLLLTLRFYGTGSMLVVVGDFLGVHRCTASRVVNEVSRAIAGIKNIYIKMPVQLEDIQKTQRELYNIARFPRCIGALDCTHVKIQSPGGENAELYRNRKGYFSINVQCICNAALKITNIVCRWPGSSHDATIFNNSTIRMQFENGQMGNNLLVGDSGYGIRPYLITPLRNPVTAAVQLFNESQIRTRNVIERCFGVWKRRFPILALGIRLNVRRVEAVVVATAVLHNIAQQNGDPEPPDIDEEFQQFINDIGIDMGHEVDNINVAANNYTRQWLIDDYFARL